MLPGAVGLTELLEGKIDYVLFDRMNYHDADWAFRKYGLEDRLSDEFFEGTQAALSVKFRVTGVEIRYLRMSHIHVKSI